MTNEAPPTLDDAKLRPFVLQYSDLKFEKVIGSGAAGEVSVGILLPMNKKVAIKRLHDVDISQNDLSFRREVKCLATLKHPFLLPFVGFTKTSPYCIVTKYVSGGSLYSAIRGTILTFTDMSIIAYGIASGMKYLHEMNIIHRDLKTQNVLLDEKKLPVICDFGSSRQLDKTMTGQCGTPNYMAPEFIRNEHYDQSVDVYSYGMILWEMLTGETPFGGKEPPQVIYMILSNHVLNIPHGIPQGLSDMISNCWDIEPSLRPPFSTIAKLFEAGDSFFPDTNRKLFDDTIYSFTEYGKRRPSGLKSNSCIFTSPVLPQLSPEKSPQKIPRKFDNDQKKNYAIRSHIAQLASAYIGGISTGTDQQIKLSIDFFESHADDPALAQVEIWPKLLPVMINAKSSLLPSMQNLVVHLAQSHEMLASIANVSELHRFIRPETFDLFLYVINFVPQTITVQMVKSFFAHTNRDDTCEKATILLCKILGILPYGADICNMIVDLFERDAVNFANRPGGHLVLRTLLNNELATIKMFTAFAQSVIPENVIAAYECSFSFKQMPELFTLNQILTHLTTDNIRLRSCALEFILRYGQGAEGRPLIDLLEALLVTILRYGSETAILLLCRIAADKKQSPFLLKSRISNLWLQISPSKAPTLMRVYVLIFNNICLRCYLATCRESAVFLSNVLRTGDNQAFLSVCWILSQMNFENEFGSFLEETESVDIIAQRFSTMKNPQSARLVCSAVIRISKQVYSPAFIEIVRICLRLISEKNEASKECLFLLTFLGMHRETHRTFLDENAVSVLTKYNKSGEGTDQIRSIFNHLKASGNLILS